MAFRDGTEDMTCKACGQRHQVKWYVLPFRERTTVQCQNCRNIIFDRQANRDYYEVRATDT